jgi:hypothetical protein
MVLCKWFAVWMLMMEGDHRVEGKRENGTNLSSSSTFGKKTEICVIECVELLSPEGELFAWKTL